MGSIRRSPAGVRTLLAAIVSGSIVLGATSVAQAATVAVVDGTVVFTAAPGEVNDVRQGISGRVVDTGAPLTAGPGCEQLDPNSAQCPNSIPLLPLVVWADDGDDRFDVNDGLPRLVTIHGQRGNDTIKVGNSVGSPALLDGGQGDDTLITRENGSGPPVLRGGPGNDALIMNEHGTGQAFGGPGNDLITDNTDRRPHLAGGGRRERHLHDWSVVPGGRDGGRTGRDTLDQTTWLRQFGLDFDMSECPRCVQRVIGTPYDDRITGDSHPQRIFGAARQRHPGRRRRTRH